MKSACILVVDDEDTIAGLVERVLTKAGHSVLVANSRKAAVAAFVAMHDQVDLVLLDWHMPGDSGSETLLELIGIRAVPVIVMSGDVAPEGISACGPAVRAFLPKPFNGASLLDVVHAVLELASISASAAKSEHR